MRIIIKKNIDDIDPRFKFINSVRCQVCNKPGFVGSHADFEYMDYWDMEHLQALFCCESCDERNPED